MVDLTPLYPAEGQEPVPTSENYQEFYWAVAGDTGQIIGAVVSQLLRRRMSAAEGAEGMETDGRGDLAEASAAG